ncbi:MAG: phosphonoacetate hydrolase [Granulosicoccus sp.]|nr:phosphonoacetate hydrolase [Granulosicoccus sp.]
MPQSTQTVSVNERSYLWPSSPVVVVCIDGSEPAYIEQAVEAGVMPWTKQLIEQSGSDLRSDCVIPSFTNPNNLSIVTGVAPVVHGICGNFYYDRENDVEVMMNDPSLLRTPTIFKAFQQQGAKIAIVTAKDKLRRLLGNELEIGGENGAICFSSEKSDEATLAENGIENVVDMVGMPVPSVYSAELSEFIFAAGVKLMESVRPDIMYLSTTDYIQHKFAPGSEGANAFYAMMDRYWSQLDAMGAIIGMTADHGMNAKHNEAGAPNVIYLQDRIDQLLGMGKSRVILPITDPYVVHHGALGSYATIYIESDIDQENLIQQLKEIDGVESVYSNEEGCREFELANDRMGDIIVVSTIHTVLGTSAERHDLSGLEVPLRSHGGVSEQTVPLLFNRPVHGLENRTRLRNFDVFDIALNHTHA